MWIPIAVAVTFVCGLVFLLMQQNLRQAANDPQMQIAEDTASALAAGGSPTALVPSTHVDVAASLATFVIVYDERGNVVASSAVLNGTTPDLPSGVLTSARSSGKDEVTWQPSAGVRIAAVVVTVRAGGSVLAGRSLREVEVRESDLVGITLIAWVVTLVAVGVTVLTIEALLGRREQSYVCLR